MQNTLITPTITTLPVFDCISDEDRLKVLMLGEVPMEIDQEDQLGSDQTLSQDQVETNLRSEAEKRGISVDDFRNFLTQEILLNSMSFAALVNNGFAKKLNIIFDIDHTLVFAFEKSYLNYLARGKDIHYTKICKNYIYLIKILLQMRNQT